MNFSNLVSSHTGTIHLIFSIFAIVFGTIVLIQKKGTTVHKRIGYLYTFSMLGLLTTAFMIYALYGRFGIFHWLAVLSSITLIVGIVPMLAKSPKNYLELHMQSMFWSVFGLYAAFAAETLVRIPQIVIESGVPNSVFYNMVGIAVFIVMAIANFVLWKKKAQWTALIKKEL